MMDEVTTTPDAGARPVADISERRPERRPDLPPGSPLLARFWAWLNTPQAARLMLVLILAVGAYLRLSHVNWDMETHLHPDERFLTMVEDKLKLPSSLGEFFDSTKSPLNPYNEGFGFFVYGTLPIFIVRVVAEVADKFNQAFGLWRPMDGGAPLIMTSYWGVHYVGRTLSGLFDLGCVWLIYVIGRRLYSRRVGLLAAFLLAFSALPLQQSHFFTVDTFGTFFSLVTFYFCLRIAFGGETRDDRENGALTVSPLHPARSQGGWLAYIALGLSLGATLACRINLAPEAGIALLAVGMRAWRDLSREHARVVASGVREARGLRSIELSWLAMYAQVTLFRLFLFGVAALLAFRIFQPYAFGGTSVLDFSLSPAWRANMTEIRNEIAGNVDMPPGHQWTGRTPFVFLFKNTVIWGLGLPLGIAAWAGFLLAFWQIARSLTRPAYTGEARRHLLPVAWVGGMWLWQCLQFVQSMRYVLPLYPLFALFGGWVVWWLVDAGRSTLESRSWKLRTLKFHAPASGLRAAGYTSFAILTIGTMLWGWGFLAIYRRPFSRVTASRWIYANVPAGSHIANEAWDDALPVSIDGKSPWKPYGPFEGLSSSSSGLMNNYDEDTPEKRELMYRWLDEADYIVLSSNRLWASIPRLPLRYPMTTLYYKMLFDGSLGFKLVHTETSFPTIFGIQIDDSSAEEAFSVYDHPVVYIFQKTPAFSDAKMRAAFGAVDLENTVQYWPKQASKAPTALLMTALEAARQRAGGTWSALFDENGLVNKVPVLVWLLLLEVLGVIAFPFMFTVMRGLGDRGYSFAKTFGILALAWLSWVGPALKVLPYERWLIALALLLFAAGGALLAWRQRPALAAFWRSRRSLLLIEEVLFLVLFGIFLFIRWGNADLWHLARGGEKPMDFAYLNAVIKSTTFPPYDPWFAGGFINYYYFGFVIVGTLIKLTGIVPAVAYNLAVPMLFALTGLGAFGVAYNLAEGDTKRSAAGEPAVQGDASGGFTPSPSHPVILSPRQPLPTRALVAGFAATLFVAFAGNLGEVKLLFDQWAQRSPVSLESTIPGFAGLIKVIGGFMGWLSGAAPLQVQNDWWFWNASRVIPDTINEFPFFTFTYADLHAHMIAFPLGLLALGAAVALVRSWRPGMMAREAAAPTPTSHSPAPSPWLIPAAELLPMLLLGFVIGALRATNTWDFPTYILVALAALVVLEAARRGAGAISREVAPAPSPAGSSGEWSEAPAVAPLTAVPAGAAAAASLPVATSSTGAGAGMFSLPATRAAIDPAAALGEPVPAGAGSEPAAGFVPAPAEPAGPAIGNGLKENGGGNGHGYAGRTGAVPAPELALTSWQESLINLARAVVAVLWRLIVVVAVASVTFYPYTKYYATAYGGLQPWTDAKTSFSDFLVVHGFFLALALIYLISEVVVQARQDALPDWLYDAAPLVFGAFVLVIGVGWVLHAKVWLITVPLLGLALILVSGRDLPATRRLALLLLALALAITMGVEVVRLQDDIGRMNTVFKFYLQAWILFGVTAAFGFASWFERAEFWSPGWRRLAVGVTALLFVGVMLYPPLAARAKIADRFSAEDQPRGLDGMAYMDNAHYYDQGHDMNIPADKAAIEWMLHNVKGSPVILEGNTPNYRWGGRFSIYTGLPSVMGWDWHERQQRSIMPDAMITRRLNQVHELYTTNDLARTKQLLDYYDVSYVIVGELERTYYGPTAGANFDALVQQGYMRVAYDQAGVRIYQVVGRG